MHVDDTSPHLPKVQAPHKVATNALKSLRDDTNKGVECRYSLWVSFHLDDFVLSLSAHGLNFLCKPLFFIFPEAFATFFKRMCDGQMDSVRRRRRSIFISAHISSLHDRAHFVRSICSVSATLRRSFSERGSPLGYQ